MPLKNKKNSIVKKKLDSKKKITNKKNLTVKKTDVKKIEMQKTPLLKPFLIALLILAFSLYELFTNGDTTTFWMSFVISAIIILPNLLWLKLGIAQFFIIPYGLVMLKTQRFINTINYLSKHAMVLEKISIIGLFAGFGLAGVDYWIARKYSKAKRIIILLISSIILAIVFIFGLGWMFSVPLLEPLFLIGLIGFIFLGLGGLSIAFMLGYGIISIIALFSVQQICPSIAPVIPGVPIPGIGMVVPFIAWISLGAILIIHEFSHGILLLKYKEKIKSVGLLLAGFFPVGAFVEQDDKTFLKNDEKKQLLVLSAGPSSNLFTMGIGIILLVIFALLVTPFATLANSEYEKAYDGVLVKGVEDTVSFCGITVNAPAKGLLFEGDKIISLNGVDINSLSILMTVINDSNYHNFVVLRNNELINVEIEPYFFENLNIKRIGVLFEPSPTGYEVAFEIQFILQILNSINTILIFFIILSFAVGMFNFLPSDPLDGGRMAKIILVPYVGFMGFDSVEESQKFIGRLFVWAFLISILLNLLPYITMFLF